MEATGLELPTYPHAGEKISFSVEEVPEAELKANIMSACSAIELLGDRNALDVSGMEKLGVEAVQTWPLEKNHMEFVKEEFSNHIRDAKHVELKFPAPSISRRDSGQGTVPDGDLPVSGDGDIDKDDEEWQPWTYHYGSLLWVREGWLQFARALINGILDLCQLVFAPIAVVLHVLSTYYVDQPGWLTSYQWLLTIFFAVDYSLRVINTVHPWRYVLTLTGFFDLLSFVPFFIDRRWCLHFVKLYSVLHLKSLRSLLSESSALRGWLEARAGYIPEAKASVGTLKYQLFVTFVSIVFLTACLIHIVEAHYPPDDSDCDLAKRADEVDGTSEQLDACLSFHDSLYMIIVTIATVGYGDITPHTSAGRAFISVTILVSLIVIPAQVSRLVSLQGYRQQGISFRPEGGHFVILTGSLTYGNISDFLSEVYHNSEYRGLRRMQVVLLGQGPESFELETLVSSYQGLVRYIPGSCRSPADMARVASRHRQCSAIFLVSSRGQPPEENDQLQVLRTLAVAANSNGRVPIFTQVLMPQTRVLSSLQNLDTNITVACVDYIKLILLARSCIIPGISTLLMAMFTSCDLSFLPRSSIGTRWLADYQRGLQLKICLLEMSPCFVGHKYMDVAIFIYQRWGAILVGLDVLVPGEDRRCPALLPLGHITTADDMGLLLSPSLKLTSRITDYRCPDHSYGWGHGWWPGFPCRRRHKKSASRKKRRRTHQDAGSPAAEYAQPPPCQAVLDTVAAAAVTAPNESNYPSTSDRVSRPATPTRATSARNGLETSHCPASPGAPTATLELGKRTTSSVLEPFGGLSRRLSLTRMFTRTRSGAGVSAGGYSVRSNPVCSSGELPGPQQVDGILAEVGLNKPNKFLFARLGGGEASLVERRLAATLARSRAPAASALMASMRLLNQSLRRGLASMREVGGGAARDVYGGENSAQWGGGTGATDRQEMGVGAAAGHSGTGKSLPLQLHPWMPSHPGSQAQPEPESQLPPRSHLEEPQSHRLQAQPDPPSVFSSNLPTAWPSGQVGSGRQVQQSGLDGPHRQGTSSGGNGHDATGQATAGGQPVGSVREDKLGLATEDPNKNNANTDSSTRENPNMGRLDKDSPETGNPVTEGSTAELSTQGMSVQDGSSKEIPAQLAAAVDAALRWPPSSVAVDRRVPDAVVTHNEEQIRAAMASRTLTVCPLVGHVVITCPVVYPDIFYVVAQLRLRRPPTKPVLLLAPEEPSATVWGSVGVFEDVFFMRGTPRARLDLIRAGVHNADKVVVLADPSATQQQLASDPGSTQEADAYASDVANVEIVATIESLMLAHKAQAGSGNASLASVQGTGKPEAIQGDADNTGDGRAAASGHTAGMRPLKKQNDPGDKGVRAASDYSHRADGGSAVVEHGVDVASASNIIVEMRGLPEVCLLRPFHDVRDKAYMGMLSQNSLRKAILSPAFAEGKVLSTAMLDTFFYRNFDVPVSNALLHAFVVGSEAEKGADVRTAGKVCFLDQRPVPSEFVGKEYNQLVRFLLINASMLCLGLYRPRGHNSAPAPYVVVNPDPASVLVKADLVYVLRWY